MFDIGLVQCYLEGLPKASVSSDYYAHPLKLFVLYIGRPTVYGNGIVQLS